MDGTERTKKAGAFAATFEKECREGVASDSRQTFQAYCEYVLELKDLRADHLNALYTELSKEGAGAGSAHAAAKVDLVPLLKEKGLTRADIASTTGLSIRNVYNAVKGKSISAEAAKAISEVLGVSLEKCFSIKRNSRTLSAKTVVEHYRLISTVLDRAEKEGLIPFNVAGKAKLPKVQKKDVNYSSRNRLPLSGRRWSGNRSSGGPLPICS